MQPPSSEPRPTIALVLDERSLADDFTCQVSALLERSGCRLPVVLLAGHEPAALDLAGWDAVLLRAEGDLARGLSAAVEACGVAAVNPFCAVARTRSPLAARAILAHHAVAAAPRVHAVGGEDEDVSAHEGTIAVHGVGARVFSAEPAAGATERRLAVAAARAITLEAWTVRLGPGPDGSQVVAIDDMPRFAGVPGAAEAVAEHLLALAQESAARRVLEHV